MQSPNQLNTNTVKSALRHTSFAHGLHHFQTIGSTNTHALEQARSGAAHGSFYIADEQTAGRGRSDHPWHSAAAQGLYLSILLQIPAEQVAWLPLLAALAAHTAIQQVTGMAIDLRWPNDLLIGSNKVGGILIETTSGAAIVGTGINLHQQSFPETLATPATSLDLATGTTVSRETLLIAFLKALDAELASPDLTAIPSRATAISTWIEGRQVEVHGPQACIGTTAGLDHRGFLRVLTNSGLVTVTTGGIRSASPVE